MFLFKYFLSGAQNFLYMEIYKALSDLGKIISLKEIGNGCIGIKEEFINDCLRKSSTGDSGIISIRVSCKKDNASFFVEFKKYLLGGIIEIPFHVESFIFNSRDKKITFSLDKKKAIAKGYRSKLLLWFTLSVIGTFSRKGDLIKAIITDNDFVEKNQNGTYSIDLSKIPELENMFKKPHWKLIRINGMSFDDKRVFLQLHEDFAKKIDAVSKDIKKKVNAAKDKLSTASALAANAFESLKEKFKNRKQD